VRLCLSPYSSVPMSETDTDRKGRGRPLTRDGRDPAGPQETGEPCPFSIDSFPGARKPPDLPRRQTGNSPQQLAVTMLADYGLRVRTWIPSGAIVTFLGESGVTPGSARAALSRLARRRVLESRRQGRSTSYRLAPATAEGLALGGAAIAGFPAEAEAWDGFWTLIAFSLPHTSDARRRALRNKLRWLGYAPLYDALWVSPLAFFDPVAAQIADMMGPGVVTVFRASCLDMHGAARRDPLDAWDLAGIADKYQAFISRWSPVLPRLRSGEVTGAEALRIRTEAMDTYRLFLSLDPRLPLRLMPAQWPRDRACEVFTALYDGLKDAAQQHVALTVARFSQEERPPTVVAHTLADLLAACSPPPS
jgi:phenylacetic acid degradation operon negative regulatory protein